MKKWIINTILAVVIIAVAYLALAMIDILGPSGENGLTDIDSATQDEIEKLFTNEEMGLIIMPGSREITIKRGDDPRGFAFNIKNNDTIPHKYGWSIESAREFDFAENCGSEMTKARADGYLAISSGVLPVAPNSVATDSVVILFSIPESAQMCAIPYTLTIDDENGPFQEADIFIIIKD